MKTGECFNIQGQATAYVYGRLHGHKQSQIEAHLHECDKCASHFEFVRSTLERWTLLAKPNLWNSSPSSEFTFITHCNFSISLLLDSDKAEAIIDHLEEIHERNIKRYGDRRARVLYVKETLVSLAPIMRWALRRAVVAGVFKHYFPAIESLMRLFR